MLLGKEVFTKNKVLVGKGEFATMDPFMVEFAWTRSYYTKKLYDDKKIIAHRKGIILVTWTSN